MRSLFTILILCICIPPVAHGVDVYVDGVRLEGVERIDITTEKPPADVLAKLVPGFPAEWPLFDEPVSHGEPDAIGYGERPIARWHNPCFESYSERHVIGVVAFHASGIEHGDEGIVGVEFVANNGERRTVLEPTRHPKLGYWGWWVELQAGEVNQLVEVRAIIYPHAGQPRILQGGYLDRVGSKTTLPTTEQSLLLWSGPPGETRTVSAAGKYQTIQAAVESLPSCDHATIYLEPGTYQTPRETTAKNNSGWLTICPAPGVCREQVVLTEGNADGNSALYLIRLQDLTIDRSAGLPLFRGRSSSLKLHLWFDGCDVRGPEKLLDNPSAAPVYYNTRSALNRSKWSGYASGPVGKQLLYGCDCTDISGDIFTGNAFTRDCTVQHTRLPGQHADLWQGYGGPPNRILCDVTGDGAAQMIFLDDGKAKNTDVAMVNVRVHYTGGNFKSQFGQSMRNVLVWHCDIDQQLLMRDSDNGDLFEAVSFHGNRFGHVGYERDTPRTFEQVTAQGWHWTENRTTSGVCGVDAGETCGRTVRWDREQNERAVTTNRGAK